MIDRRNFFDQLIKNDMRTYKNIQKIATDQGDVYTAGCLLDYPYLKKYYTILYYTILYYTTILYCTVLFR